MKPYDAVSTSIEKVDTGAFEAILTGLVSNWEKRSRPRSR